MIRHLEEEEDDLEKGTNGRSGLGKEPDRQNLDRAKRPTNSLGEEEGVVIIAEAGVNHNGSITMALSLIEKAKEAGADIIKFQAYDPGEMVVKAKSQYQMLKELALGEKEPFLLQEKCVEEEILSCASVFDEKSLALMEKINAPAIKIPSGRSPTSRSSKGPLPPVSH